MNQIALYFITMDRFCLHFKSLSFSLSFSDVSRTNAAVSRFCLHVTFERCRILKCVSV